MNSVIFSLEKWARLSPQKIFIADENTQYSFKAFYDLVARFSGTLASKKIQNGDFVVIHLSKKIEHLIAYCALLNLGAVSVHLYPEREDTYVEFAARQTQAKAIISDRFKGIAEDIDVFDFDIDDAAVAIYESHPNEIAYVMFTSGTTSSPKAVLTTQENVLFVTDTLITLADMKACEERELILLPLGSTGGLGHFHACMMLGNYVRLYPGFYTDLNTSNINKFCDTMAQEAITGVLLTPRIITHILKEAGARFSDAAQHLRYALANVMPMPKETIEAFLTLLPHLRFCTYYGSTEASRSIANVCRQNAAHMHTTGKPVEGVDIEIRKANEKGEGELYIRGGNVMKGYLHDRDSSLDNGWFASGDVARIDEAGFITVLGRLKDTLNMDGLKLFPSEIETLVGAYEQVRDCAVCALTCKDGMIRLCLAVVLDEEAIDKKAFGAMLSMALHQKFKTDQTQLYTFKIPHRIYFENTIPKTELGKIKRESLSGMLEKSSDFITIKG